MTEKESPKTYWFLPSISDVIFVIVLAIILSGKGNLLGDADTGYHIRAGEYIIGNLKVPDHDIFSHISPPVKWTAHEWLSEVIFALIHRVSGLTGIVAAASILIASIYALLFKYLRSSVMNIIVAALVVALATGTSTIHWLARPHIFSLLFTLIWYMVLDTYQVKKKNYLYFLPPLMLLWVNLHGGFIAGFMLLAVYITGNLLKVIFVSPVGIIHGALNPSNKTGESLNLSSSSQAIEHSNGVKEDRPEELARIKIFLLIFILCLLAALLNPQ